MCILYVCVQLFSLNICQQFVNNLKWISQQKSATHTLQILFVVMHFDSL